MKNIVISNALDPETVKNIFESAEHDQKMRTIFKNCRKKQKPKTLRHKNMAKLKGAYENINSKLR